MRHVTSAESPRATPSPVAAAAVSGATDPRAEDEPRGPEFWGAPAAPEAHDQPILPDVVGPKASKLEALERARSAQWAPPFAWARAMELLFELGMGNMEDARGMRSLAYTATQQAKRQSLQALEDRNKAQRIAATGHIVTAAVFSSISLSQPFMGEQFGPFMPGLAKVLEAGMKRLELDSPGTGAVTQAEYRQKAWETLVAESQGKIETASAERLKQSQNNLSALLDMLLQVEQKRGQVVSQINTNV